MNTILFDILAYIGITSTLCIVIIGFKKYRLLPMEMKILTWFFLFDFLTSALGVWLAFNSKNNHWLTQVETPFRYGCFVWVLTSWIPSVSRRTFLRYSIPAFMLVSGLLLLLNSESWTTFDVILFPISFFVFIILGLQVLFHAMHDTSSPLVLQPAFWVSTGLILFSVSTITALLFARQLLVVSPSTLMFVWAIRNIISIVGYFCFTGGFLCVRSGVP
ncbi:MAG: hypothetical protein HYZ34_07750 [Ignavibacteriae bacterium]|nr:hypothetical protein [Ignavibacteriota bacterium]